MTVPAALPDGFARYVAPQATAGDPYLSDCATEAEAIVAEALRAPTAGTERPCPPALRARAVREVGAELYARRGLKNGIATFGSDDGLTPIRVNRDPLYLARSILAPFVGGPFA